MMITNKNEIIRINLQNFSNLRKGGNQEEARNRTEVNNFSFQITDVGAARYKCFHLGLVLIDTSNSGRALTDPAKVGDLQAPMRTHCLFTRTAYSNN